ncbi:hypothetical protein ACIA8O_31130 [Kitasatospora sp. NPDC051853]|uniref:hypothetical protein n=1 Tax=Kitasatospora sp. NPDC051853 TaxID=3364058 RepID=UPI00378FEE66
MPLTQLVLNSGRTVELHSVTLSSTYGGFLEGYPCGRVNDLKLAGLRRQAVTGGRPGYLVEPPRELTGDPGRAFGPVELLPAVTCVGRFTSEPVDPELPRYLHESGLTVIWFQPTPELPSGTAAVPGLLDVPWDEFARDEEL